MCLLTLWFVAVLLGTEVSSSAVNVTIDDEYGDQFTGSHPTYFGSSWTFGPTCPDCKAIPPVSDALDQTWHDATTEGPTDTATMSVTFNGTAVYVFCILANQDTTFPGTVTYTNLSFSMDGGAPGSAFIRSADATSNFYANSSVYTNTSLSNGQHTLTMYAGAGGPQDSSLVLFDYVLYTTDSSLLPNTSSGSNNNSTSTSSVPSPSQSSISSSSPSKGHTGAIAGGVIGGIIGLAILGILVWLCLRARRKYHEQPSTTLKEAVTGAVTGQPIDVVEPFTVTTSDVAVPQAFNMSSHEKSRRPVYYNATTTSPGTSTDFGSSGTSSVARRRDDLERQVRELEQIIASMGSASASAVSPSQYSNTSSQEMMQREIGELRNTVLSLQAQQRLLLEQTAPPVYDEHRRSQIRESEPE